MATDKQAKATSEARSHSPPNDSDRQRPAHEVRLGRVKAAVWANPGEGGVRYSVSVCRVYKDQHGRWQTSESFGRDDLLLLAKVVDRAHTWICEASGAQDAQQ